MPKFQLQLKAQLTNISQVNICDEFCFQLQLFCTNCQEKTSKVSITAGEWREQQNGRKSNFVMKCKFCKKEGSVDVSSVHSMSNSHEFQPLATFEARGLQPCVFFPEVLFINLGWLRSNKQFKY